MNSDQKNIQGCVFVTRILDKPKCICVLRYDGVKPTVSIDLSSPPLLQGVDKVFPGGALQEGRVYILTTGSAHGAPLGEKYSYLYVDDPWERGDSPGGLSSDQVKAFVGKLEADLAAEAGTGAKATQLIGVFDGSYNWLPGDFVALRESRQILASPITLQDVLAFPPEKRFDAVVNAILRMSIDSIR